MQDHKFPYKKVQKPFLFVQTTPEIMQEKNILTNKYIIAFDPIEY